MSTLIREVSEPIKLRVLELRRFNGRLIIAMGYEQATLSPEQEAEFWKQVAAVIDKTTAWQCYVEAPRKKLDIRK